MSETFESEQITTRDEVATILRNMADGVAGGRLRFGHGDETIVIEVPDEIEIEVEFETEDGEMSVEVELEWPDSAVDEEGADTQSIDVEGVEMDNSPVGPATHPQSLAHFEVFLDKGDEWRWRLVHRNGNVIATGGEGYTRKHNALKGLQSVMQNSPDAEIREDTDL